MCTILTKNNSQPNFKILHVLHILQLFLALFASSYALVMCLNSNFELHYFLKCFAFEFLAKCEYTNLYFEKEKVCGRVPFSRTFKNTLNVQFQFFIWLQKSGCMGLKSCKFIVWFCSFFPPFTGHCFAEMLDE